LKIYTKTGDTGSTGLFGGSRVAKDHLRIEAYGTIDELNSTIGLIRAQGDLNETDLFLATIQQNLFVIGSQLATPEESTLSIDPISEQSILDIETHIDQLEGQLEALTSFILPGGHQQSATTQVTRTICRRAERRVVTLQANGIKVDIILRYLNRLSDYLFVLARYINKLNDVKDIPWKPN